MTRAVGNVEAIARGDVEMHEAVKAQKAAFKDAAKDTAKDAAEQVQEQLKDLAQKHVGGDKNFDMIRSFQREPVPHEEVMDLLRQFGLDQRHFLVRRSCWLQKPGSLI